MKLSTKGFGWHLSKRATTIIIIGAIILVPSFISSLLQQRYTPEAIATTNRNSFVSGCNSDAAKYPEINVPDYCGCAYDELSALYPDFATNTDRLNRIIKSGYNQAETDVMVSCLSL